MAARRVLIFIVAYNAEKTIASVLGRIPVSKLPEGTEVLVIDDSSADRTFETARAHADAVKGLALTVLYNPVNQGYGGNQKLGYEYAIQHGFDVVALVHGDGQYAPEKLPELIAPILSGEADACFGSRMMVPWAAVRNGMPLYKYVGNRILTAFQNALLGLRLSEFHSGYRIYSVDALRKIPFRYNTNDFHFDTEIIIQLAMGGLRIHELPIPTYYGDEICYVNGLAYAGNVVRATLASRIHRWGLFYKRKYDVSGRPDYGPKLGYTSSHTMAIDAVPPRVRVLDLACGPGHVARALRAKGCHVTGIDREAVEPDCVEVFLAHDLETGVLPADLGVYDFILALDCLEHLDSPERLLAEVRRRCFSENLRVLVTVPNVAFGPVRLGLLFGQFNYGQQGILDLTHKRLFTFRSLRWMLEQEGYVVKSLRGIPAPYPKAIGDGALGRLLVGFNRAMILLWPTMFSYQILAEAHPVAPVERLLAGSLAASSDRARKSESPA